jgi:hypothetical protein
MIRDGKAGFSTASAVSSVQAHPIKLVDTDITPETQFRK